MPQVLTRAAAILRSVAKEPNGMSLGELARELDLAKSTVQRIVGSLADEGLLFLSPTLGGIRIGPEIIRLASATEFNVVENLRPHLQWLVNKTGETVDLSVLNGGSVVFLEQLQGKHRLSPASAVGERFPVHVCAPGIMMLAISNDEQARKAIANSKEEHENAPIEDEKLWALITEAREKGYAVDNEFHSEGISAVGIAIKDPFGRPLAVSLPTPTSRFLSNRSQFTKDILEMKSRLEDSFEKGV